MLAGAFALLAAPAVAADPDCGTADLIKSTLLPFAACVDPAIWQQMDAATGQEFIYFRKDNTAGFAVITEKLSVPMNAYHDGILAFAEKQTGAAAGSITSYDDAPATIGGKPWASMHYNASIQGNLIEFLDYYYSEDGLGSVQLVFWSTPAGAGAVAADVAPPLVATVTLTP